MKFGKENIHSGSWGKLISLSTSFNIVSQKPIYKTNYGFSMMFHLISESIEAGYSKVNHE